MGKLGGLLAKAIGDPRVSEKEGYPATTLNPPVVPTEPLAMG